MASRAQLAPYLCAAIVLVLNLAFYSMMAPLTRAIELAVCYEHYLVHDPDVIELGGYVDEKLCKVVSIQERLAWILALNGILHFCCDLVVIVPLGVLADRIGRKPVMLLNFLGQIVSWAWIIVVCYLRETMNTKLVLLGPAFTLFGGATHLTTALVYSEAASYTQPDDRTAIFSAMEAIIQTSQLVGPVIGSLLLQIGVFTPFPISLSLALLSVPLALILPSGAVQSVQDSSLSNDPQERLPLLNPSYPDTPSTPPHEVELTTRLGIAWKDVRDFGLIFKTNQVARYASFAFLIVTLGKQSLHILLQYVSKRFHVSIAAAGYLFSIKAVVVLIIFGLILPFAKRIKRVPVHVTNIRLAKTSIIALMCGSLLMGLSWNIWALIPSLMIYASGFGFSTLVRALVTATVADDNVARLYSGLAIAETLGSLSGATFVTAAFTSSLSLGGIAAGTPFYVCASFYAITAALTWTTSFEISTKIPVV